MPLFDDDSSIDNFSAGDYMEERMREDRKRKSPSSSIYDFEPSKLMHRLSWHLQQQAHICIQQQKIVPNLNAATVIDLQLVHNHPLSAQNFHILILACHLSNSGRRHRLVHGPSLVPLIKATKQQQMPASTLRNLLTFIPMRNSFGQSWMLIDTLT